MSTVKKSRHPFLVFICVFLLISLSVIKIGQSSRTSTSGKDHLGCFSLPGANETVVILRTGSTELAEKLPIHLSTTLRCYPNYLIFSDYEETFSGERVLDALDSVDQDILANHPDFELYRRLQEHSRASLTEADLKNGPADFKSSTGNDDNPGWRLDKWKFLPMMNRTMFEYPDKSWYVFVEADSFVLWTMLLQWLASKDATEPHYTGSQMFANGELFAHGGSGFAVSQPALRMVVEHYTARKSEFETLIDRHWAGDIVLGKAFRDAGVSFSNAWPIIQGDFPGVLAYARPDGRPVADEKVRQWCYPAVSYHHMTPAMIADIWDFEHHWIQNYNVVSHLPENPGQNGGSRRLTFNTQSSDILRHKDIFELYVMPRMMAPRDGWDNLSDGEEGEADSVEECRRRCEAQAECKQYSFDAQAWCRTRVDPRLGRAAEDVRSGWIEDRIRRFPEAMAPCEYQGWVV